MATPDDPDRDKKMAIDADLAPSFTVHKSAGRSVQVKRLALVLCVCVCFLKMLKKIETRVA